MANKDESTTKKQKVIMLKVTPKSSLSEIIKEIAHCGNVDIELYVSFLPSARKVVVMRGMRTS